MNVKSLRNLIFVYLKNIVRIRCSLTESREILLLKIAVIFCLALVIAGAMVRAQYDAAGLPNHKSQIDSIFHLMCHQIPSRSLTIFGGTAGLCARCLFFYFGALCGITISLFSELICSRKQAQAATLLFIIPLVLDGTSQYLGLRQSTNVLRSLTGFAAGIGCALFGFPIILRFATHRPWAWFRKGRTQID